MDTLKTQATPDTRHRTKKNNTITQHRKLVRQSRMDTLKTQTTPGTRHRTKKNKTITQYRKLER